MTIGNRTGASGQHHGSTVTDPRREPDPHPAADDLRRAEAGGGNRTGARRRHAPREAKEIDKKEIQEKIRQTQAKLAGSGGRGKSLKAKYRRANAKKWPNRPAAKN